MEKWVKPFAIRGMPIKIALFLQILEAGNAKRWLESEDRETLVLCRWEGVEMRAALLESNLAEPG